MDQFPFFHFPDLDFALYLQSLSIDPLPPPSFDALQTAPPSPVVQAPVHTLPQQPGPEMNTIPPHLMLPWFQAPEFITSAPGNELPLRPLTPRKVPPQKRKKAPFPCTVCQLVLHKKSTFIQHMRTHTREKPFVCEHCSRGFSLKCNLTRHGKTCKRAPSSSPPPASPRSKVNIGVHRGIDENIHH